MTEKRALTASESFWGTVKKLVEWWNERTEQESLQTEDDLSNEMRPPAEFVTLEAYSKYIKRNYPTDEYDPRSGQEYAVMKDGDNSIKAELLRYENPDESNQKQMISFFGDSVHREIVFFMDGEQSVPLDQLQSIVQSPVTAEQVTDALESIPSIGKGALNVTVWPGRWLVEFVRPKGNRRYPLFQAARHPHSPYDIHITDSHLNATGEIIDVSFPIPLIGSGSGFDPNNPENDAVSAGSMGLAVPSPSRGFLVAAIECRQYNGDGDPAL